jgi:hypothetical protein
MTFCFEFAPVTCKFIFTVLMPLQSFSILLSCHKPLYWNISFTDCTIKLGKVCFTILQVRKENWKSNTWPSHVSFCVELVPFSETAVFLFKYLQKIEIHSTSQGELSSVNIFSRVFVYAKPWRLGRSGHCVCVHKSKVKSHFVKVKLSL